MSARVQTQALELPLLVTKETCSGRTYIVTGANTGIGYEAAKHLVALDAAKVILAVRNASAGETARAEIEADTGKKGVAEVWTLDKASYDSVKAFADKVTSTLDRLDAVIDNAAVAMGQRTLAEGHLLTITVNVLSTFLLGVLLMPKLSESAKKFDIDTHLVVVGSGVGFDMQEPWNGIKDDPLVKTADESFTAVVGYPMSKLMVSLGIRQLAALAPVSRTGVIVKVACPGFCKTDLSKNAPPALREKIVEQHKEFGRTADVGSRTPLFATITGKESHGCYLDSCEIANHYVPSWVTDEEGQNMQKHTWDIIAAELEKAAPGCVKEAVQG